MDLVHRCCAGLDVHKKTVVACIRRVGPEGAAEAQVRTFGTMTAALLELADWLTAAGVTHVAMESTGVYWQPVYALLEGLFVLLVVNAHHIKHVPGRKTDVKDAEWIAQLLQYGLLTASFVPPRPVRELRDLTRQRAQLVADRAAVVNRVQKVLEGANIKLACVATDVLGASGRAMIAALIAGQTDPEALAALARGRLKAKRPALRLALRGYVTDHHRFQLEALMDQEAYLEGQVARYEARIAAVMAPFAQAAARLRRIPGVGARAAEVLVAEIGTDMTKFPSAGHLASWAGMCPGNDQSAGKRRSGKTTKGSQWLRSTLVQVAWAAARTKATIFPVVYRRWAKRLGRKKALVAVGHKILTIIYALLRDQTDYRERWAPGQAA
jgi:transposase